MRASWKGFALGTEVRIVTHSAFVTDAREVIKDRLVLAKRPIAVNAVVYFMVLRGFSNRLIDWDEAMVGVGLRGIYGAI